MGKKKASGYNDFLDSEKLRDNADVRTTLQGSASVPSRSAASSCADTQDTHGKSRGTPGKGRGKGKAKGNGEKRPQLTHFLCLPLVNSGNRARLESALGAFKQELGKEVGVPEKAVRPVGTLHLTLGVMILDRKGVEKVGLCLKELNLGQVIRHAATVAAEKSPSADTGKGPDEPLSIDLKGLHPMQQAKKTSILYADPTDASGKLYPFAETLRELLTDQGFMVKETRPLRLHATIMNTIYAKPGGRGKRKNNDPTSTTARKEETGTLSKAAPPDPTGGETESDAEATAKERSEGHGPDAKSWLCFDATTLIERYKDFSWADDVRIDRVQVCKMGAKKILDDNGEVLDEEYECVFERTL